MKNKHILINIEDDYYNEIESMASKEYRTITAMTYLLLLDGIAQKKRKEDDNNDVI